MTRHRTLPALLFAFLLLLGCGGEEPGPGPGTPGPAAGEDPPPRVELPPQLGERIADIAAAAELSQDVEKLVVDYPLDESVFPPEFIPPTFLWHDPVEAADTWLVSIRFSAPDAESIVLLVPGAPPPKGKIDPEAFGPTNAPYEGTEYQNSAVSWTPSRELWTSIKQRTVESPATVSFHGFAAGDPTAILSRGSTRILTSRDPVGAPIFYRDVPLMPGEAADGRIKPLSQDAIPLIAWRLRDVARQDSKLVLKGMATCGNCHSFSLDGKTLGMDVDGPDGDKGMYAVKAVSENMVIDYEDTITWNSFPGKPEGHRTIGFLSRISPDGRFVVTTGNEALFVTNFKNYKLLQVFYPTRGILVYYSRDDGEIRALPGADDTEFVHCDPVWSPDGSRLVFARAPATDPYPKGRPLPTYSNDPNELPMQYSLYRMPFDGGKGGKPVPVEGASDNGMSNTFPKISPDGKWIVFVKCRNGQLMRPDSRLWIVPLEGGEPREMRCNTRHMNSWHSFSPNSRWMVFSSKSNTPYTQAFLTHIDEDGNDSPAILIPDCTAANRAVNLPEFLNAPYDALDSIDVPATRHHVHYRDAQKHLEAERYPEAVAALDRAIEVDPGFAHAHVAMGHALWRMGHSEEAIAHLEKGLEADPRNVLGLKNLGHVLLATNRPVRAIEALERLMTFAPAYPGAAEELERARDELARVEGAIEACRMVLEQKPDDAVTQYRISTLYINASKPDDARKHMDRAAELEPEDPALLASLAWMLATTTDDRLRDAERALKWAEKAVELTKGHRAEALDVKAAALAASGRFEEAVATAEKALDVARKTSPDLVPGIEQRRTLYRGKEPFRTGPSR